MKKTEVFKAIKEKLELLKSMGVKRIGVFGSIVREEETSESDIDILIEFENGKEKFSSFMSIYRILCDALNSKVDIVTKDGLSPYIGPIILKEVEYIEKDS